MCVCVCVCVCVCALGYHAYKFDDSSISNEEVKEFLSS